MTEVTEPRWLDETQQEAWRGLLVVVSRAFPEIERTLKGQGILAVHYHIYVTLSDAPDQTLGLGELADRANLSPSRLTHRLRRLVERGDVIISDDPDDRRAKNATLTATGRQHLEAIAPGHIEDVQRLIFDSLDPSQTEALAEAMTVVADHLCQHPEFLNPQS